MQISIVKPGLLSTIQDLGRPLYRSQAMPISGAMDSLSARIANMAVGNAPQAAVIEFTYAGAAFTAESDLLLAYAGDGAILCTAHQPLASERPLFVPAGTTLTLEPNADGCRTYVAVSGGWDVPEILGSRSTYITAAIGGWQGRALQAGDILGSLPVTNELAVKILNAFQGSALSYPKWSLSRQNLLSPERNTIRMVPGPEFSWFNSRSVVSILTQSFTLSTKSNRMGYQLEGEKMERRIKGELLSTAVTPGTVQVTHNGDLVLLMADAQTTGGYPRIAQVAAADLPLCGQLKPGDTIHFSEISHREAELLYIAMEQDLHKMRVAVQNKFN